MKLTKQGVRDLNTIVGKSLGRKVELPGSKVVFCVHPHRSRQEDKYLGTVKCGKCGHIIYDPSFDPYY